MTFEAVFNRSAPTWTIVLQHSGHSEESTSRDFRLQGHQGWIWYHLDTSVDILAFTWRPSGRAPEGFRGINLLRIVRLTYWKCSWRAYVDSVL
jgi:hypothetical protein